MLGNGYQNEEVKPDETVTYLLIYEINPVDYGAKFTLYYREFKSTMQSKLRKFKIEVTDLTGDLEMGTSQLGEEMKVTLPAGDSIFTISNYQMADSMNYYYERCYVLLKYVIRRGFITNTIQALRLAQLRVLDLEGLASFLCNIMILKKLLP